MVVTPESTFKLRKACAACVLSYQKNRDVFDVSGGSGF